MGLIASFLVSVFGQVFSFLSARIGTRLAMIALALAAFAAALTALYTALKVSIGTLVFVFDSTGLGHWLVVGLGLVLPDNWDLCLSVKIAVDLAVFLYQWNMRYVIGQGVGG